MFLLFYAKTEKRDDGSCLPMLEKFSNLIIFGWICLTFFNLKNESCWDSKTESFALKSLAKLFATLFEEYNLKIGQKQKIWLNRHDLWESKLNSIKMLRLLHIKSKGFLHFLDLGTNVFLINGSFWRSSFGKRFLSFFSKFPCFNYLKSILIRNYECSQLIKAERRENSKKL